MSLVDFEITAAELYYQFSRENKLLSSIHNLHDHNSSPSPEHIEWRPVILEWYYKVVDHFKYDREVVAICIDYIDRFMVLHQHSSARSRSRSSPEQKEDPDPEITSFPRNYQLVAITCLYLASKLQIGASIRSNEQDQRRTVRIEDYTTLSQSRFEIDEITSMEFLIINTLGWNLHPTTPKSFVYSLLALLDCPLTNTDTISNTNLTVEVLYELALYFAELFICLPQMTPYFSSRSKSQHSKSFAPSSAAYAAILFGMDLLSTSALPISARETFNQRCTQISRHIDPEHYLHPNNDYIINLKQILRENFNPHLFFPSEQNQDDDEPGVSNIIEQARELGLLNMSIMQPESIYLDGELVHDDPHCPTAPPSKRCRADEGCQPPSPTSPLDGP